MKVEARQIPFVEAIEFFKGKVNLPTERWDDLMQQAHVRAFSVAGLMRDDWITEVRAAVENAIVSGTGLAEFQKDFEAFVDRSGWKFNAAGKTEPERRAWRARIIYKTNMRVSYMAGRYKQLTDPDVLKYRPYWQYKHSGAMHPRKMHLAWDGMVLDATDPWWDVHFPPNGWGCGCDVKALSKRQLAALGKSGADPSPGDETYQGNDKRTGEMEVRHQGIDRGWEYNPGKEWLHGIVPTELREPLPQFGSMRRAPEPLPPLPAPQVVSSDRILPADLQPGEYVRKFLAEFDIGDGEAKSWRDKSGGLITIDKSLFEWRSPDGVAHGLKVGKRDRNMDTLLIADAIRSPDEIWIDWAAVKSGVVLKRAYLKRVVLPDGKGIFVRFEWTAEGWIARTGFSPEDINYLDGYRMGALIYRK